MSILIEGLPNDIAIRCLAWVPYYLFPKLESVSHSWRATVLSTEFYKARQAVNSTESLLCVCAFDPENIWQLYDPNRDIWLTFPVLPSLVRNLAKFGVVSVSGKLFVLGGRSDAVDPSIGDQDGTFATNKVWAYDPVFRYWARRASMIVPSAMFACCVWNGKILVAGGFTTCRKSISKAEIYDPVTDTWDPITDLDHTHNSACTGLVIDGAVHVVQEGLTTVQVLFIDTVHRYYSSVKEIYCSFIALMDENTVRLWLKDHQDASEKLVRQQAEAFQLQLDTLRTELQATRGDDPDRWIFAITEYFSLLNTPADQHLRIMEFNLEESFWTIKI
ncbi:F-box/kelch-repeat protein SKIP30 [Tanacetum coccineum]